MGLLGDEEGVLVRVFELERDDIVGHALGLEILGKLLALLVEEVGEPFEKKHAEDVLLVLGGIHVAAQIVAGAEQKIGKLAQGELGHGFLEWSISISGRCVRFGWLLSEEL